MHIGETMKRARKKAGLTQKELAEKAGLALITIQQYERNVREPRLDNIKKIANILNLSFHELDPLFPDEEGMYYADELTTPPTRESDLKEDLLNNYEKLNIDGKLRVNEHVELLLKVPEYRKEE